MKVLSIKQPYAHLIISGKKKIELRTWNTKFRGKLLIHASKIPDKQEIELRKLNNLETGKIIGKVELIDIKKYSNLTELLKDKNKLQVKSKQNWKFPLYGFILKNPKKVKPIEAKGQLGFWNY